METLLIGPVGVTGYNACNEGNHTLYLSDLQCLVLGIVREAGKLAAWQPADSVTGP